jgi:hypothetical protein
VKRSPSSEAHGNSPAVTLKLRILPIDIDGGETHLLIIKKKKEGIEIRGDKRN